MDDFLPHPCQHVDRLHPHVGQPLVGKDARWRPVIAIMQKTTTRNLNLSPL